MLKIDNYKIQLGNFKLKCEKLHIKNGDRLSISGSSGSGKTVFLESLAGRYPIQSGTIQLDGIDITGFPPEKRKISMVYQDYLLFPFLTVRENILFSTRFNRVEKDKEKADFLIKRLNLKHIENSSVKNLSGGEKQRTALARAVITSPKVLLLDEPFSALDWENKSIALDLIDNYLKEKEITSILVTHDPREAQKFSKERVFIEDSSLLIRRDD